MTAWLPISTYPYDGTWGLFRGAQIPTHCADEQPPFVIARDTSNDALFVSDHGWRLFDGKYEYLVTIGFSENEVVVYADPTEWKPVKAARIML